MDGANWITMIIQPRWAIEEYAMIFRSCVWFRPPQPPTRIEVSPRRTRMVWSCRGTWTMRLRGAIFCHVERISPAVRFSPWRTSGSQM